jgi:hypothetical protein
MIQVANAMTEVLSNPDLARSSRGNTQIDQILSPIISHYPRTRPNSAAIERCFEQLLYQQALGLFCANNR